MTVGKCWRRWRSGSGCGWMGRENKLGACTFEDPYGGREVVDSSGCLDGCGDDGWGGDEIVGEGVV